MVGGDDVDVAGDELVPQGLLLVAGSQWRCTLRDRPQALHILVGEVQIVRARFDRHVDAPGAGLRRERDTAAGADMDDVQRRARLLRQQQRPLDRLELGEDRAGVEEGARRRRGDSLGQSSSQLFALRVHGDRPAEPRRFPQAVEQRDVIGARELGQT